MYQKDQQQLISMLKVLDEINRYKELYGNEWSKVMDEDREYKRLEKLEE